MVFWGTAVKRSVTAVAVGLLAGTPGLLQVVPAEAQEPPQVVWKSGDRLWWNDVWLKWDVANGTTASCSIDGGTAFECQQPWDANKKLSVAHEGLHELTVTPIDDSVDPAVSGEPVSVQVGVDRTAPTVSMSREDTRNRVSPGDPMAVHLSYEDETAGVDTVECVLAPLDIYADGNIPCTQELDDGVEVYDALPEDGYLMYTTVVDRAGNSTTSDYLTWYVDGSAPHGGSVGRVPKLLLRPRSPRLYFEGWESGPNATSSSHFTMRSRIGVRRSGPDRVRWRYPSGWEVSGQGVIPRYSRRLYKMVPGRTYCVDTEAVDEVGNRQPWKARRCLVRALDDRVFAASSGWRAGSPRGAYRSTAKVTTGRGERLRVRGEKVYAFRLRALRCSRCGSIVVKAGRKEIGRWSLRDYSRRWAVKSFRTGRGFTGRITVRTTSRRRVVVDAFGMKAIR